MAPPEREIQTWIESISDGDEFLKHVCGREKVEVVLNSLQSEHHLPSFPIDYLLRRETASAAGHVLSHISFVKTIVATKNISATTGELLFPDLLLVNPNTGHLIIVELKRSAQTEREAITELLGYEHEIRNHLPFLSNLDISFVLISTEFSTLLEHAVSQVIMWESKRVLCLKLDADHIPWRLKVHLPRAWQAIGQGILPPSSLQAVQLRLYPKHGNGAEPPDELFKHVLAAFNHIVREGDRSNSHGFSILWEDQYWQEGEGPNPCRWNLTLVCLNPFAFLTWAHSHGFIDQNSSALARYFIETYGQDWDRMMPDSYLRTTRNALRILDEHWDCKFEGFMDWATARQELRKRAFPLEIDFWGSLGDYAREYVAHPYVRRHHATEIARRGLSWNDPRIGLALIYEMTGEQLFQGGQFTCSQLLNFGVLLGSMLSVCNTIKEQSSDESTETAIIEGFFSWLLIDFIAATREILFRYMASPDLNEPPPTVRFGSAIKIDETFALLRQFTDWFSIHFITDNDSFHRRLFQVGLSEHPCLETLFLDVVENQAVTDSRKRLAVTSSSILALMVQDCLDHLYDDPKFQEILTEIARQYLQRDLSENVNDLQTLLAGLDSNTHCELFRSVLMPLLDRLFPPLFHRLVPPVLGDPDWEWMRLQVDAARQRGCKPCIVLGSDGVYSVGRVIDLPISDVDAPDTEVLFHIDHSGVGITFKVQWKDLQEWAASGSSDPLSLPGFPDTED